ncbi:Bacl-2 [Chaetoceros tenuissimus]|uniref:Bacl-2 n=1 Tax=Chaetoceros tenuissimus TaxID=426638 RepID=A0AAD3D954_9STRA|nr:Bacl-2 [Chaetoceros tenuissimus]
MTALPIDTDMPANNMTALPIDTEVLEEIIDSTTTLHPILGGEQEEEKKDEESLADASLALELPDLEPLTETSIPIAIEHVDMNESTSVLLSGEPTGNETLIQQIEHFKDAEEDEVTETDYELLKRITTNVGNYDPLDHEKPERFIPVLEARGTNDNDKDEFGHRRDTIPIAKAVDEHTETTIKAHSAVFQFLEERDEDDRVAVKSNLALKNFLKMNAQGIIVRNNPGTLSATSQKKFDDMLRELADGENGLMIMTHPDVMSTLGAKDSLVKIKHLKCGLEDTEVYYDPESFKEGFRKSIAFQPRVVKQNRGSQGEGIWIVKLKDGQYCDTYGECMVSLDTELELMEAWDNHVEYHTVGEFIEFCVHGRTAFSGEWTSTGDGRYFDGGLAAGSMMVDQRFLPRIVEGEVRCLFVGSELVEIVHKKPAEGGLSATLASGAIYTKYEPDDPKFASLVAHLKEDVPRIMDSFDMAERPLPLLWTADYIYGDTDDELYVGEINCSCPGITQQLEIVPIIAKVALESTFPDKPTGLSDSESDDEAKQ